MVFILSYRYLKCRIYKTNYYLFKDKYRYIICKWVRKITLFCYFYFIIIIIISLLTTPLLGHRGVMRTTRDQCGVVGTNGLTCLPEHGIARDNKFFDIHIKTDQRCLTYAIARRSALTWGYRAPRILFRIVFLFTNTLLAYVIYNVSKHTKYSYCCYGSCL
jgi:hypothetical protein